MASFTKYYRIDNNFNNFPYKKYSNSYFKKKKNPDPNLLLLTSWCVTSVCATSVTCSHTENASDLFLLTRYTNYNFKNNLNLLFKRILIFFFKFELKGIRHTMFVGPFKVGSRTFPQQHLPGDLSELRVRQRERPQSQVRRRVGDTAQHVLDRVDALKILSSIIYYWPKVSHVTVQLSLYKNFMSISCSVLACSSRLLYRTCKQTNLPLYNISLDKKIKYFPNTHLVYEDLADLLILVLRGHGSSAGRAVLCGTILQTLVTLALLQDKTIVTTIL